MNAKLILVSKEGDDRSHYVNHLQKMGVLLDVVSSFGELHQAMTHNAYQGIVIDLVTRMKTPKHEKDIANEILESTLPMIQLKWDKQTESIQTLYIGQSKSRGDLEEFIRIECAPFTPRKIRLNRRRNVTFNLLLAKDPGFPKDKVMRTVTINISKGGFFIFSTDAWKQNDPLYFIVKEIDDQTPIEANVRRFVPWGREMNFPGVGVCFNKINDNQLAWMVNRYQL